MILNNVLSCAMTSPLGVGGERGRENPFIQYQYQEYHFNAKGKSASKAMALLALNDTLVYEEPLVYGIYDELADGKSKDTDKSTFNDTHLANNFELFPNPATDQVTVEVDISTEYNEASLVLIDASGRIVLQQRLTKKEMSLSLPVTHLANGLYKCVIIVDGTTHSSAELIVTR